MDQAQTPAKPEMNPGHNGALSSTPNSPPASAANPQLDPVPETETAKVAVSDETGPSAISSASMTVTASGNLKRLREEDEEAEAEAEAEISVDVPTTKRRVTAIYDVVYRIVVPSRQIGKVIGIGGHRIQKIWEDAKATIKIADAISVTE